MKGTQFFDSRSDLQPGGRRTFGLVSQRRVQKVQDHTHQILARGRAEREEFKFLRDVMGDIEVGYLRNGSRLVEEIPVALHSEAMDHHMGVFATTGMGKSNFMKVFAASCMRLAARRASPSSGC